MGVLEDNFLNQYIKKPNRVRVFQEFFQVRIFPTFLIVSKQLSRAAFVLYKMISCSLYLHGAQSNGNLHIDINSVPIQIQI